jgi:uncharacterized protein YkwD
VVRVALLWGVVCLVCVGQAAADDPDYLLAPETVCPHQMDIGFSAATDPVVVMRCMVNYARAQAGRRELRPLQDLEWSAQHKAVDILGCQEFSHSACGRDALHWVRRSQFAHDCYRVKENIAYRSPAPSVRGVMGGWLDSEAHRRALLLPQHRWFGFGLAYGPVFGFLDTAIWVAHFGYRC